MSDEKDNELSDLFASSAPVPHDAAADEGQFADRVSARLRRRRRLLLTIRVALLIAVVAVAAPLVPSFILSLLRSLGFSIS